MGTLLTTGQLQELLQVDRITIYRMLQDGRLQGFKVGGQWRFSRQAIEAWLQDQSAGQHSLEVAPGGDPLPLSCLRAIQDLFGEMVGVAVLTTTAGGTPLTEISNSCAFCDLVLSTPRGRERCTASWQAIASLEVRLCHAGLCYVSRRIGVQGHVVAAVHAGQYLELNSPAAGALVDGLDRWGAEIGADGRELRTALDSVHILDETRARQIPRLLQRVAHTFTEIGEERLKLLGRLQRIAEMTQL